MDNLAEFFHMGGYAFYVWGSYGLAAVMLSYNIIGPLWRLRGLQRRLSLRPANSPGVSKP